MWYVYKTKSVGSLLPEVITLPRERDVYMIEQTQLIRSNSEQLKVANWLDRAYSDDQEGTPQICKVRTRLYSYKLELQQVRVSASQVAVIRLNTKKKRIKGNFFSAEITDLRFQNYNIIVTQYIGVHINVQKLQLQVQCVIKGTAVLLGVLLQLCVKTERGVSNKLKVGQRRQLYTKTALCVCVSRSFLHWLDSSKLDLLLKLLEWYPINFQIVVSYVYKM